VGQAAGTGLALFLVVALSACGDPPALEVGPVGYGAEAVAELSPEERSTLARITAFGLAVADERVDALIAPRVQADLRSIMLQRVAMEIAADDEGVDESVLREAYAGAPAYELEVRHLVVLSERWRPQEHRDSARARAAEALARVRAGEDFEAVVAEYSDEPRAAERGGLLQPGREGSWVPEFWRAASSLEEGEVSGVVETEFGFHVLRLEDRRPIPFQEVRDDVLERFVDLPRALGRASAYVAEVQSQARVDTLALSRWQAGETVERAFVRWPDSLGVPAFDVAALEEYARTFRSQSPAAARALPPDRLRDLVRSASRTHILLAEARAQGIEVSETQRLTMETRWRERIGRWAAALGFEAGLSGKAVKERALRALSSPAQSAAQARAELPRLYTRLEELYAITSRATPPAPTP
jgi:hypothetical protein